MVDISGMRIVRFLAGSEYDVRDGRPTWDIDEPGANLMFLFVLEYLSNVWSFNIGQYYPAII